MRSRGWMKVPVFSQCGRAPRSNEVEGKAEGRQNKEELNKLLF